MEEAGIQSASWSRPGRFPLLHPATLATHRTRHPSSRTRPPEVKWSTKSRLDLYLTYEFKNRTNSTSRYLYLASRSIIRLSTTGTCPLDRAGHRRRICRRSSTRPRRSIISCYAVVSAACLGKCGDLSMEIRELRGLVEEQDGDAAGYSGCCISPSSNQRNSIIII